MLNSFIPNLWLKLELTLDDIKWAIVGAKKLKIKQEVNQVSLIVFYV